MQCANTYFANEYHAQIVRNEQWMYACDQAAWHAIVDPKSDFYMWDVENVIEALQADWTQIFKAITENMFEQKSIDDVWDVAEFDWSEIENMRAAWAEQDLADVGRLFVMEFKRVNGIQEDLQCDWLEIGRLITQRLIDYWHKEALNAEIVK